MNPMYNLALDGYGPPLEPPDGYYYFMTNAQMAEQAEREATEQEDEQYGE